MNNCIKNCFSSENRGHRSGGRGFYLLLYGFRVHELRVHELRAGGSLLGSRAQSSWIMARELRAHGSELTDCTGKLTFTEVERGFGTVKVN